jgi:oligopeptide/dipeptide ABC transporter ATP-binding protein
MADSAVNLVEIRGLRLDFLPAGGRGRPVRALRGLDLDIRAGETLAIVGESGSGKSVTARSLAGLHEARQTRLAGSIRFFAGPGAPGAPAGGLELANAPESVFRPLRGRTIAMVFQDPASALNPLLCIGDQIAEALQAGRGISRRDARAQVPGLLARAGIDRPADRARQYPHEFSGGMLQRVMVLMAAAAHPRLLVADEPTSALDTTVQVRILDLINSLKAELGMTVLLISHDLGLVRRHADRIAVMYAGRAVETAAAAELLAAPAHPYTRGLLASIPRPSSRREGLLTIEGAPPPGDREITGCAFAERCPRRMPRCAAALPALEALPSADAAERTEPHLLACHLRDRTGGVS